MNSLLLGLVLALLAFTMLGLGPSLLLMGRKSGFGFALAVAPTVGFVVVTLVGTYLTILDIPVSRWTGSVLILGSALTSIILTTHRASRRDQAPRGDRREVLWCAGGFIFTLLLSAAPPLVGGLDYSVLRGNGSDSFNYIALANYLDHEPFSWAERVDPQTLVNRDQSYERARRLLQTRWSTSMALAFTSRVAQAPAYTFDYDFALLSLLLAYGPAYLYARALRVRPSYSALTASAICLGFWAQLILDIRAESQINSIPLLILLMLLVSGMEDKLSREACWADYVAVGGIVVALAFLYVEIVPLAVLAMVLFFGTQLVAARFRLHEIFSLKSLRYGLTVAVVVLASSPLWPLLLRFAKQQASYASVGRNTWHLAHYSWFYSNPLAGFWGFGPLESSGTTLTTATSIVATLFASMLTVLLVFSLVRALRNGGAALRLSACTALAAAVEFGYLALRGQLWAAAKGLSFGYVFFFLCLAGCCLNALELPAAFRGKSLSKLAVSCVLVFLCFQTGLGFARVVMAAARIDYPHYILEHGEYRRHSWDLSGLEKALDGQQGVTVWSDVSNDWLSEYLDFAFSHRVKFINIGGSLEEDDLRAKKQERSQLPQYIITERLASGPAGSSSPGVVATNPELALIRTDQGGLTLLNVNNPNGIEKTGGGFFFWMGDKPTVFTLISPASGCVNFSARMTLGPSSDLKYRTLLVGDGEGVVVHDGEAHWSAPVHAGVNEVSVTVKEKIEKYLPTDSRGLLLRVDGLKVESGTCEAARVSGLKERSTHPALSLMGRSEKSAHY